MGWGGGNGSVGGPTRVSGFQLLIGSKSKGFENLRHLFLLFCMTFCISFKPGRGGISAVKAVFPRNNPFLLLLLRL